MQIGELLLVPPICSVPLLVAVLLLGSSLPGSSLPLPLWGAVLLAYGACGTLYVLLMLRRRRRGRSALQLVAQGILLPPVALVAGAPPVVAWAGLAVLVAGLVLGGYDIVGSGSPEESAPEGAFPPCLETIAKVVAQLPLPVLLTDTAGVVRGVSPPMATLLDAAEPPLEGQPVEKFLDIGALEISFEGKTWIQEQVPLLEEGAVLFLLSPASPKSAGGEERSSSRSPSEGVPLLDPQTGLFSEAFVTPRCEEEIARDYRYRRWMTAVWLRVGLKGVVTPAEEHTVLRDFAKMVKGMIRTCDVGFVLRNGDLLLLLPETPLGGAQTLVGRMYEQVQALMGQFAKVGMRFQFEFKVGFHFYKGTEPVHVHSLLDALQASLKVFSPKDGEGGAAS